MPRALPPLLCLLVLACGPRQLRVTLSADNNSGQSGTATLTDDGKTMTVVVETVAPLYQDAEQFAHIHPGTCGELGPAYVNLTKLGALATKPGAWGSTTTLTQVRDGGPNFGFDELSTGEWAINIHDAREFGVYVTCGEIPKP
jgi:hypothetical protein